MVKELKATFKMINTLWSACCHPLYWVWPEADSVFLCAECFCEGGDDKHIPLLRDVFDAFPNTPVNIDIKVNNDTLIKKVCVCVCLSLFLCFLVLFLLLVLKTTFRLSFYFSFIRFVCMSFKAALVLTIVNLKLCMRSVRQTLKRGEKNWGGLILLKCSFYLLI